jgi:hypothetical protein
MRVFTSTTNASTGDFQQLSTLLGHTGTGLLRICAQTQAVDVVFNSTSAVEAATERTNGTYVRIGTAQTYGNVETIGSVDLGKCWIRSAATSGTVLSVFIGS